jgi:hypothetical protein
MQPREGMWLFQDGGRFFLVNIYAWGEVTLQVKENGWSDTWSPRLQEVDIPIQEVDSIGNDLK